MVARGDLPAALDTLQSIVKIANDLCWVTNDDWRLGATAVAFEIIIGNKLCLIMGGEWRLTESFEITLEAVFLKVMDMICRHKGSDPQTVIDTVYNVRPTLLPQGVDRFTAISICCLEVQRPLPLSDYPKEILGTSVQDLWREQTLPPINPD